MPAFLDEFLFPRRPTPDRPLLGQTVLVVEDSRFAGETMRLMCLRGGARIRRADSLKAAARHLGSYRPSIVLVDPGLPDGSGLDLISQLVARTPRVPTILAVSGDPGLEQAAFDAGADDFLTKPFGTVAAFHNALLARLPADQKPMGLRLLSNEVLSAAPNALHDDLALLSDLLSRQPDQHTLVYAARFGESLGRSVGDTALTEASVKVLRAGEAGEATEGAATALADVARQRLSPGSLAM